MPGRSHTIDVMIIGAQKAGTTSLKNYLGEHPRIVTHQQKEFAYFMDDSAYELGIDSALKEGFPKPGTDQLILAKAAGLYWNPKGLKRLKEHNPEAKLIFTLRNPVERAYSSFNMERSFGWIKRDFDELPNILEQDQTSDQLFELFIHLGLYAKHLEYIYTLFPKESVKLVLFEDLKENPDQVVGEVLQWLGLPTDTSLRTDKVHNKTSQPRNKTFTQFIFWLKRNNNPIKRTARTILPYRVFSKIGSALIQMNRTKSTYESMSSETENALYRYFEAPNEKLSEMSGLDLSRWSKG